MSEVKTWSVAAESNNSAPPNGFPEGMSAGELNNASREVMAAIARWHQTIAGNVTSTGSGGGYALSYSVDQGTPRQGDRFVFKANHDSPAGGSTITINGADAVGLRVPGGEAVGEGVIEANGIYEVLHDGSNYILISGLAGLSDGSVDTPQLADGAVTENKIENGAVTENKIEDGAVTEDKIAAGVLPSLNLEDNSVTFAKIQNIGSNTIIGRGVSGTGDPAALSASQVRSLINVEDGATRNTGALADLNSVGSSQIASDSVLFSRMQNISSSRIVGRASSGTGDMQQLTAAQVRSILNVANGATRNVGDLADLDSVGSNRIDNGAITSAKLASSVLSALGGLVSIRFVTSTTAIATPSGASSAFYILVGGGGGSGGSDSSNGFGGGGGQGGAVVVGYDSSVSGTNTAVIGSAGSNGSSGGNGSDGGDGGNSTFLGSTARGGDRGDRGTNGSSGNGGTGEATATLASGHQGIALSGFAGGDGGQLPSDVGSSTRAALAIGRGGPSRIFGFGRGGGSAGGSSVASATSGCCFVMFFG